jgi:tRNA-dihydrouridine synthase
MARAADPQNPLMIGKVPVPNRVLLAPMSGITDAPFRRLVARLGAGVVVSEMTTTAGVARELHKRWRGAILTSENPAEARVRRAQTYDAFAREAHA